MIFVKIKILNKKIQHSLCFLNGFWEILRLACLKNLRLWCFFDFLMHFFKIRLWVKTWGFLSLHVCKTSTTGNRERIQREREREWVSRRVKDSKKVRETEREREREKERKKERVDERNENGKFWYFSKHETQKSRSFFIFYYSEIL